MPNIERIFERYNNLVGVLGGDLFDVWRPDYSQVDNTPRLVAQDVKYRCDPATLKLVEPRLLGVLSYDVFGPRDIIQSGDILMRSTPDHMTPPITIATYFPVKSMIGFRSSLTCDIEYAIDTEDKTSLLYSNVYFEFLGESYPGLGVNKILLDSLKMPEIKAVMFDRPNIKLFRTHLVQKFPGFTYTNPEGKVVPYTRRYSVETIDATGPYMVLTLRVTD